MGCCQSDQNVHRGSENKPEEITPVVAARLEDAEAEQHSFKVLEKNTGTKDVVSNSKATADTKVNEMESRVNDRMKLSGSQIGLEERSRLSNRPAESRQEEQINTEISQNNNHTANFDQEESECSDDQDVVMDIIGDLIKKNINNMNS